MSDDLVVVAIGQEVVTFRKQQARPASKTSRTCPHDKVDGGRCARWVERGVPCDGGPPLRRWVSEWEEVES